MPPTSAYVGKSTKHVKDHYMFWGAISLCWMYRNEIMPELLADSTAMFTFSLSSPLKCLSAVLKWKYQEIQLILITSALHSSKGTEVVEELKKDT